MASPEYSYTYEEQGRTYPARMTYDHPDYPEEYVLVVGDIVYRDDSYVPGWITTSDQASYQVATASGYPCTLLSDAPVVSVYRRPQGRPRVAERRTNRSITLLASSWQALETIATEHRMPMGRAVEMLLGEYRKTR